MFLSKARQECYYYDPEDSRSEDLGDLNYEQKQALRMSKVPSYRQVATLDSVIKSLQELPRDIFNNVETTCTEERGQAVEDFKECQQFYNEGSFPLSDIKVTVKDLRELYFPLDEKSIQELIAISSKAKFVNRNEEVLDLKVRDTQVISADKLVVEIKEETQNNMFLKMKNALNIDENCCLTPQLQNMLIYAEGQFFGWHKDTEKVDNIIATMVIVLPSAHEGGNLYVRLGSQSHSFISSGNLDHIKYIAFYSDCEQTVYSVLSGYRVVLTYNVELQYPIPAVERLVLPSVDQSLSTAVVEHFAHRNNPNKLVVFLLHTYSKKNLTWNMMKGRDRTYALALLAVAKDQDLIPCLALGSCIEIWEQSECHGPARNEAFVNLNYWVDEHNLKLDKFLTIDYKNMAKEVCTFKKEFWSLGEPDREETLGWFEKSPAIREQWYYKACVVLLKK